jgi:hypothetical protein
MTMDLREVMHMQVMLRVQGNKNFDQMEKQ